MQFKWRWNCLEVGRRRRRRRRYKSSRGVLLLQLHSDRFEIGFFFTRPQFFWLSDKSSWPPNNIFCAEKNDPQTSGQSYKHSTIVIYDPRVVIWGVFKSRYDSRVVIYERTLFIRLATENALLLFKWRKYHCIADLLFGFSCIAYVEFGPIRTGSL